MKLTREHFDHIEDRLGELVAANRTAIESHYDLLKKEGRYASDAAALERRFRWDLLYAARLSEWLTKHVYPYANDEHIDTALRRVVANMRASDQLSI